MAYKLHESFLFLTEISNQIYLQAIFFSIISQSFGGFSFQNNSKYLDLCYKMDYRYLGMFLKEKINLILSELHNSDLNFGAISKIEIPILNQNKYG